jgi:hypothetical protein
VNNLAQNNDVTVVRLLRGDAAPVRALVQLKLENQIEDLFRGF